MALNFCAERWVCSSCACFEISSLASEQSGESAMMTFFKLALQPPAPSKYAIPTKGAYTTPAAHYIFTAGPEGTGGSGYGSAYGTNFAKYIEDNNLGKVATCGKVANAKFHGAAKCQTWIYQPDKKALIEWYEAKMNPPVEVKIEPKKDGLLKVDLKPAKRVRKVIK